ncbi:MAG TPA: PGPGW domain-containing protein [Gaiellaceae bacterium]|nr:PGPGW domain-containing protein [Gaiellaceae bacterium]
MAQRETGGRPRMIERIRARKERHRERSRIVRIAFAIAGFVVLLAGVVMLFTPGPGWAVIVFALAILALEFAWAERALERVIDQMERASEQVTKGSPVRRAVVIAIGVLAAAGFITLIAFWDVPLVPG